MLKKLISPSGALATKGATAMEKIAKTVDESFPILTNFFSSDLFVKNPLYISILKIVAALFNTLLNVLKTAPITIAAKTPTKLNGNTFLIKCCR